MAAGGAGRQLKQTALAAPPGRTADTGRVPPALGVRLLIWTPADVRPLCVTCRRRAERVLWRWAAGLSEVRPPAAVALQSVMPG